MNESEPFLNIEFWRSLVATAVGALLALLIAGSVFWLQQRDRRRATKARRDQLAEGLIGSLEFIFEQVRIVASTPVGAVPIDALDLTLLDSTAAIKYELISDLELNRDIDRMRTMLGTLKQWTRFVYDLEFSAGHSGPEDATRRQEALDKTIVAANDLIEIADGMNLLGRLRAVPDP